MEARLFMSSTPTADPGIDPSVQALSQLSAPSATPPLISSTPAKTSTAQASTNGLNPAIFVTSSTAILTGQSIFVQATNSNFSPGTALNDTIAWDFGDPGSAHNQLKGFNAAHAYDKIGVYFVTLTLTTPNGTTARATQVITVASQYANTLYVAANGSDSNDGLSPTSPIQTLARVNQIIQKYDSVTHTYAGNNTQILFNAGDTFNETYQGEFSVSNLKNVFIGSYGVGAQPTIYYTGPKGWCCMINMSNSSQGITVQGLAFDSIYTNNNDVSVIPTGFYPAGNNITLRNNTMGNLMLDFNLNNAPNNVNIVDNVSPDPTALSGYFAWVQGTNINIVGNRVANSIGESNIRIGGADHVLVDSNTLHDDHKSSIIAQTGTWAYVSNNVSTNGGMGVGPVVLNPNDTFNECVFEGNVLNAGFTFTAGASNAIVRNNVVLHAGINIHATQTYNTPTGPVTLYVQNITVCHNTVYDDGTNSNDTYSGFMTVSVGSPINALVYSNLFVNPVFHTGHGQGLVSFTTNNVTGMKFINNIWAVPITPTFQPNDYFWESATNGDPKGYLSAAQWQAAGFGINDVYSNVVLTGTYTATVNGLSAGSSVAILA